MLAANNPMSDQMKDFVETAKGLARNPLGIIALFIVLVYGFASLVTAFAGSFSASERMPLVYFLVVFPVLVLIIFTWLVSKHSGKLFAPSDFKNEDNYVKLQMEMQLSAVASLTAAASKNQSPATETEIQQIISVVQDATPTKEIGSDGWRTKILWVDDRPENNVYERKALEAVGLTIRSALSTNEALEKIELEKYAAIISDMGRREGPREGYVLLDSLRQRGNQTPLFFYASSNAPEHKRETAEHGGQGCTNNAQELFQMVTQTVFQRAIARG